MDLAALTALLASRSGDDYCRIQQATFSGLDLTGRDLTMTTFRDCTFEQVVFDDAVLKNAGFLGQCRFLECSFRGASFETATLGEAGSVFEKCNFDRARLSGFVSHGTRFVSCDFGAAKLWRSDFFRPQFEDSSVSGQLNDVRFVGAASSEYVWGQPWDIGELDCGEAEFHDVDFDHATGQQCRLPKAQRFLVFRGDVAGFLGNVSAGAALEDKVAEAIVLAACESLRSRLADGQTWALLQIDTLRQAKDPAEAAAERAAEAYLLQQAKAFAGNVTVDLEAGTAA